MRFLQGLRKLFGDNTPKEHKNVAGTVVIRVQDATRLVVVHGGDILNSLVNSLKQKKECASLEIIGANSVQDIQDNLRNSVDTIFLIHTRSFLNLSPELVRLLRDNRQRIAVISASPDMPRLRFYQHRVNAIHEIFGIGSESDRKWLNSIYLDWNASDLDNALAV